jgi:hypothetical protein
MTTALTDLRDIGPYVAKIITDSRTMNKYVFCYGELLSQEALFAKMEELSGEKIERKYVYLLRPFLSSVWPSAPRANGRMIGTDFPLPSR